MIETPESLDESSKWHGNWHTLDTLDYFRRCRDISHRPEGDTLAVMILDENGRFESMLTSSEEDAKRYAFENFDRLLYVFRYRKDGGPGTRTKVSELGSD